jgi:hypothetical protein
MARVTTARRSVASITPVAMSASTPHENVSPMMKPAPPSTTQPTRSSNILRTQVAQGAIAGEDVRVADVARQERVGPGDLGL